jgi:3'-phosphoadenosine 5'-phosphosulfate sulfotransferase (PAPS reductase)/FAD synthetase
MIIVPISGGKDSQCCLELALETGKTVLGLFNDTGWEHPLTYKHINWMSEYYNVLIWRTQASTVEMEVIKRNKFPSPLTRFCTKDLKIRPSKRFYIQMATEFNRGFEVWLGVRQNESNERAKRYAGRINTELIAPHDFMSEYPKKLEKLGVMFRLPIVEWTTEEVMKKLSNREHPLYSQGSMRVGCFPCLASGDRNKKQAFEQDEFGKQQREIVLRLEKITGKSIWTSKKGQAENATSGCSFCEI